MKARLRGNPLFQHEEEKVVETQSDGSHTDFSVDMDVASELASAERRKDAQGGAQPLTDAE